MNKVDELNVVKAEHARQADVFIKSSKAEIAELEESKKAALKLNPEASAVMIIRINESIDDLTEKIEAAEKEKERVNNLN